MKHVVVGGASGFLGTALVDLLRRQGHRVTRLVRSGSSGEDVSRWDPASGTVDPGLIDSADAVVNLSGAPIPRWPWTASYKRELVESRVNATQTLAQAIADAPSPTDLISGSAMGFYGSDRGDELLTESSSPGDGFLADVVRDWEAAAGPAVDAGARVCFIRTSLVLDKRGGTLKLMLPAFRLGLGGKIGSGAQYFSVMSLDDWTRGVEFLITEANTSGPYNFANPHPVTNAEFTLQLGAAVGRRTFLQLPAPPLRIAAGDLSNELLGSRRVVPEHLRRDGFSFADPNIESVIASALK